MHTGHRALAPERRIRALGKTLGGVSLRCGDSAMEHYMNGWAVYQTVACRLEGAAAYTRAAARSASATSFRTA